MVRLASFLMISLCLVASTPAGTPEKKAEEKPLMEQLDESLAKLRSDDQKLALLSRAWKYADPFSERPQILKRMHALRGETVELYLQGLFRAEEEAGMRRQLAEALGETCSPRCVPFLENAAANDDETKMVSGCSFARGDARAAAAAAVQRITERYAGAEGSWFGSVKE